MGSHMTAPTNNRILMLLENQPYPQDHRVRREATALAAAGYRVSVICPSSAGQCWRESVDDVRIFSLTIPPSTSFSSLLSTNCSASVLYSTITIYPQRCIVHVFQAAALPSFIMPSFYWRDLLA